jgi:DNA-binding transcriptional ArsR family regulator
MPKRLNDVCEEEHLNIHQVRAAQAHMIGGLEATRMAEAFRGLSDPNRVRMISTMLAGEMCVYDLAHIVQMTQSAVSHQLATLRDSGLVKFRKTGRKVYYSLQDEYVVGLFQVAQKHSKSLK